MKVLLDQGLPRGAADELRRGGVDTVHAGEVGMARATDAELVDYARVEGRVLVTLDADFHALLALSGAASPSVVRIRMEGLRAAAAADLVRQVLDACAADLQGGAMVTVDAASVRVRTLPLVR